MRSARDEPGGYGVAFADVRMAFEVAQAVETEDHYVVTLSFRPEGDFSGTPGREQFYIRKEGAVAIRQVLSLPSGGRRLMSIGAVQVVIGVVGLVVAIVGVLVGMGVIPPGDDGKPPTATATLVAGTRVPLAAVPASPTATATAVSPTITPTPLPSPTATPTWTPAPPTPTPSPTSSPTPTDTPIPPTATASATPTRTHTPVVIVVTATPKPTKTPTRTSTPTRTPTRTATPTLTPIRPTQTAAPAAASGYGPVDGTIVHNPDDNVIAFHRSGVTLANAVFEARFFNPYPVTEGTWSSGFIFRQFGGNELSAVFVRGSGQWYQYLRTGDAETSQQLRRESSADIDTSPSGSNHLRVIALEKTGWLFINGKLAGELDLSMWDKAGDIRAIGSWFAGDEIAEKATLFEDFSVRALVRTFGPTDGTIAHNPNDNSIAVRNSSGTLANAVFEARFHNPYPTTEGSWNSGFLFRNPKFNEYHAVVLKGNGNWIHYLSTGDVGTQQQLRSEQSVDIDTSPDGSNHIRVIALEDEGWLFINGNLAGELDLSMWGEAGGVRALGSFFRSSEIAGKATSFEDFNVWSVGQ